jgi:hypothetical protein
MCVIGAGRRAARGESARAILERYYPGLALTRLDSLLTRGTSAGSAPTARAAAAGPPPSAAPGVVPVRRTPVTVVPAGTPDVEQLAARASMELSRTLGVSVAPIAIEVHATLDGFRLATGQPWWVNRVARGSTIDLAPLPVLAQGDGLERAVRLAVIDLMMAGPLADRAAWVRAGAARYFSREPRPAEPTTRVRCPTDAELTLAISAAAQREADARAEACFARELARVGNWRDVR